MPKINDEYDIGKAFEAIENELIASMIRNMKRHKLEEIEEDKQWTMWQAEMLKSLEKYKKENQKKYKDVFKDINKQIKTLISIANTEGQMSQEISIFNAIKNGFKAKRVSKGAYGEFFKLNERKLEALIKATMDDMKKAETAVLRMANDQYRKVIYNAQVYANTGAGTYEKAVDMATKDMLEAGLNCIVYANGARHLLSDYADMAIRTASKRAYLQGEGLKRQEWGISTVIVNKRGNPCPKCLPFCGKVLIDDVWSGGKASDGPYPLMSKAIEYGLYHPRCKDSHTTYFPGISTADDTWTEKELEDIGIKAKQEAKQQYAKRQVEKFKRLEKYSLDKDNQECYKRKSQQWENEADRFKNVKRELEKISDHSPVSIFDIKSKYKEDILETINDCPDIIHQFIQQHRDDIVFINESALTGNRENKNGIRVNFKTDFKNERGKWTGTFHEIGHRVDRLSGRMSHRPEFKEALEKDFANIVNGYQKMYNCTIEEAYKEIGNAIKGPEFHSVSDLFGAMSGGQCVGDYCHNKPGYWNKLGRLGREAFAHFFEAMSRRDSGKIDILKQSFPQAYKMFEDMIGELL